MDTFDEIISFVQSGLNINENSSLFPPATVKRAINSARVKSERLFRWTALEDAKTTNTQTDQEYYDAPDNWTPQSVWRITIDGELYGESPDGSPLTFPDYLKWKEDNPDSTDKKWAIQWLRFFVSPTPSSASSTIVVWGQKNGPALVNDSDTTIFSYSMPEGNEAIALEAISILKKKGTDVNKGGMYSDEAKQILAVAYGQIREEKAKSEKNLPFLDVPDMFRNNGATQVTGNFTNTESL